MGKEGVPVMMMLAIIMDWNAGNGDSDHSFNHSEFTVKFIGLVVDWIYL